MTKGAAPQQAPEPRQPRRRLRQDEVENQPPATEAQPDFQESQPDLGKAGSPMGKVISSMSEMPKVRSILTSVDDSNPAFRIPKTLQDALIVIKTTPFHAMIYFDPVRVSEVSKYFSSLHAAISALGLSDGAKEYPATGDIIRQVRINYERSLAKTSTGM